MQPLCRRGGAESADTDPLTDGSSRDHIGGAVRDGRGCDVLRVEWVVVPRPSPVAEKMCGAAANSDAQALRYSLSGYWTAIMVIARPVGPLLLRGDARRYEEQSDQRELHGEAPHQNLGDVWLC